MKRKTSNILICVLAAIALGCAVMAIGTFGGWFGDDENTAEKLVASDDSVTAAEMQENTQTTEEARTSAETENSKAVSKCTISIKCASVLKHMDKLKSGKEKYVPSNGIILAASTIEFKEGQNVYDILARACSAAGIPVSARSSSMGIYVEGINGLFEFDCGKSSGWMYSVNGSTPNHSCGEHNVKNGDNITWYYTCGN